MSQGHAGVQISVLIPTYNRPTQFAQALASVAAQDQRLIGEILVGDDSDPASRPANQAAIAASPLAPLIRYLPNDPAKGTYPNQCFLGTEARCEHILFLHHDDILCEGGLATLAQACAQEQAPQVAVWFGRNLIMDENGQVDMAHSQANDQHFGKAGTGQAQPMWQWALTQSLPPNGFLITRDAYVRHMAGPRDGNVGDWGLTVRLANSGIWGRFVAEYVSAYRVQPNTVTTAGRGMDVHLWYELALQLNVPRDAQAVKERVFAHAIPVAAVRYLRDRDRGRAWKCLRAPGLTWRQRISLRNAATLAMLLTPRALWYWRLRYRD